MNNNSRISLKDFYYMIDFKSTFSFNDTDTNESNHLINKYIKIISSEDVLSSFVNDYILKIKFCYNDTEENYLFKFSFSYHNGSLVYSYITNKESEKLSFYLVADSENNIYLHIQPNETNMSGQIDVQIFETDYIVTENCKEEIVSKNDTKIEINDKTKNILVDEEHQLISLPVINDNEIFVSSIPTNVVFSNSNDNNTTINAGTVSTDSIQIEKNISSVDMSKLNVVDKISPITDNDLKTSINELNFKDEDFNGMFGNNYYNDADKILYDKATSRKLSLDLNSSILNNSSEILTEEALDTIRFGLVPENYLLTFGEDPELQTNQFKLKLIDNNVMCIYSKHVIEI